jgi:hypothetical protein
MISLDNICWPIDALSGCNQNNFASILFSIAENDYTLIFRAEVLLRYQQQNWIPKLVLSFCLQL